MKYEHIEVHPGILGGKPIIRGTRIPVILILRALKEGMSVEELLDGYPRLTREDIIDAKAFGDEYFTSVTEPELAGTD